MCVEIKQNLKNKIGIVCIFVTSFACDGIHWIVFHKKTNRMTTTRLKQTLKTHFGFENFRSKLQEDVVKAVVKGKLKKPYI